MSIFIQPGYGVKIIQKKLILFFKTNNILLGNQLYKKMIKKQ